jgi:beta-galactosidase
MKTLQSGNSFVTVVVNKSTETRQIEIKPADKSKKPDVLFAGKNGTVSGQILTISPEETVVIEWK